VKGEEFWPFIRELESLPDDAGATDFKKKLEDAISVSGMRGEIYGEIRLALEEISTAPNFLTPETYQRIEGAKRFLNDYLGWGR
jgi:hypothetical protein